MIRLKEVVGLACWMKQKDVYHVEAGKVRNQLLDPTRLVDLTSLVAWLVVSAYWIVGCRRVMWVCLGHRHQDPQVAGRDFLRFV